jgi:hypothetical protein
MSGSHYSPVDTVELQHVCLQCALIGRADEALIAHHLKVRIKHARSILNAMIEIGFYDPATLKMDLSKLPETECSDPMTCEEFSAYLDSICRPP